MFDESRYLVLFGGAGSGKSVFVSQKIVSRLVTERGHTFLCARKVAKTIAESIFSEIKQRIQEANLSNQFVINKSTHSFTHIITGNRIICTGLDEPEKIKSISGITGIWLEEATEFESNDFDQLRLRIRGEKQNYVQFILTFNPIDEDHWLKAWIESKPKGLTFDISTYEANQFLDDDYKQMLEEFKNTNTLYYDVYVKAKWGVMDKTNKFFYLWGDDHISNEIDYNGSELWLSFDFNVDPMTCIVAQSQYNETLHVLDEIRMNDSSIYTVTDYIKAKYKDYYYIVTGDASGRGRTGTTRQKLTYWQIIRQELSLGGAQIKVRSQNLGHISSRILCNAALEHKNILVHSRCKDLISDCRSGKIDDNQKLVKTAVSGLHFLDTFRYLLDANFPNILTIK
jgi:phage terminase large subunit